MNLYIFVKMMSDDIAKQAVSMELKDWSFKDRNLMTEPKERLGSIN